MYEIAVSVVIYYYRKIHATLAGSGQRVKADVAFPTSLPVRHCRPAKNKPPKREMKLSEKETKRIRTFVRDQLCDEPNLR